MCSPSADTLNRALVISNDPMIHAELARSYARLQRPGETMQAIQAAEQSGGKDYKVLLVTANALQIMGSRDQAMMRYSHALESSDDADRLRVRLALGMLFAEEGKTADRRERKMPPRACCAHRRAGQSVAGRRLGPQAKGQPWAAPRSRRCSLVEGRCVVERR